MNVNAFNTRANNKRPAEDTSSSSSSLQLQNLPSNTPPRILRRHHHRRRNIAAEHWGLDIPLTPQATPSSKNSPPFNIYKAILRHPNLFFQFALRLPYPTITDLYAIDKEFHYRLNKYSVSLIHDYARYHAPLAGHIFTWTLYPRLCISDPMLRPMDDRQWLARDVPGFRWLGMILHRQNIVRCILTVLAMEGHRVPAACEGSLMKFWVLMESNTTKLRQSFLRDKEIWTDMDIVLFQLFLVKLDMRFADPVLGNGACTLGHLLLCQRSLSALWRVLSGKMRLDYDVMAEVMINTYGIEDLDLEEQPWIGEMADAEEGDEVGRGLLAREGWRHDGRKMQYAVDMVIAEGIRRGLHVQQYYVDFMLYGYVDHTTGKNIPVPTLLRRDKKVRLPSEGWPEKELRNRMIRTLDVRFGVYGGGNPVAMDLSMQL